MGKVVDMLGKQCGRLHVFARGPNYIEPKSGFKRAQWWCKCTCGNTVLVAGKNLRSGNTKSCGCYGRERKIEAAHAKGGKNRYEYDGDVVIGYSEKSDKFYFDAEDYERVSKYYWYKDAQGYFSAKIDGKKICLHRFVMNASIGEYVDHINHQKENNCKANLRIVTSKQNNQNQSVSKNNTSGYTGVNFNKNRGKWLARIMVDRVTHNLGSFDNIEDAINARKTAEEKYFGQYSYDNSMAASPLIGMA